MEEKKMKIKEFNQIKKEVKGGNLKVLTEDIVKSFTPKQAEEIDNEVFNHEIPDYLNPILDTLVSIIQSGKTEGKKVANKKAPAPQKPTEAPKKEEKKAPKNNKTNKNKAKKLTDTIEVGDVVKFRVEGEEIEHLVKIIYKSKYDVIAITQNEREVFKIRKSDFNKQVFEWRDRRGESYNIIVTL